jgi:adenylate kinase
VAGEGRTQAQSSLRIVLLGAPGSGKGTQAERLAVDLGVVWISTGEMLRQAVAGGSELGRRVSEILDSGALVDDSTMAQVVERRLGEADASGGFLLDGYPRTQGQAESLNRILEGLSTQLDLVLFIDVPEEELVRRALARKREDDRGEVIQHRLSVYKEKTEPLIEYYRGLGLLERIDGNQSIESVTQEILATVAAVV